MRRLVSCIALLCCAGSAFAQPAANEYAERGRPMPRNDSPEDYDAANDRTPVDLPRVLDVGPDRYVR